ncbi:hypothetical protein [Rhodopirellula sallentina]|uniref:Putative secreted protein n=1 Tax=Rhodopirellula sallentina SM41 TaxID=1263870 RepID=M5U2R0_9BACT|nr:hypothetical protein [Rhodopirellula sallentina]EMI55715.1 putative secreted protein [Rhodopirellula sallentina SM41]
MRFFKTFLPVTGLILTAVLSLSAGTVSAQDKETANSEKTVTWTEESLQQSYINFLKQEGYSPRVDEDGDVAFKFEGRTYYLLVSAEDPNLMRLAYPNFWSIENEEERLRAQVAALKATKDTKVAKVFLTEKNTWGIVSLFLADPEAFHPVFPRCLSALRLSVNTFADTMRGN